MPKKVLVGVPDLLLQSRILDAAKRLGVQAVVADGAQDALDKARADPPGLIILDLESPKMAAAKVLPKLRSDAALCAIPTIGFYSHVDKALADRMVQAGCDRAMPRGQFVEKLDELLKPFAA